MKPIATAWVVTGPLGFDGVDGTSQVRFTTDQGTVCLSDVVTAAPAAFSTVSFTAACARGPAEAIARVEVLTAGVAVWDVASVEFEQQPGGVLHQWLSAAWGGRNGGPLGGSRAGVALLPPAAFGGLFDVTFRAATSTVTHSASVSGFDVTFHSRDLACNGGWLADLHAGRTQAITVKCPFEAGAVDRVVVAGSEWGVGGDGWIVDSAQLRTGPNWRTLMVDGTHPPYRRMIKKATPSAVALFLVPFSIRILPSGNLPLELRTGAAEAASVAVRVLSTGGAVCTVQVPVAEITRGSIVATPACTFGGWDIDEIAVVTAAVWSWGLARLQCTGGHTGHQWQTYVSPLFGWSASAEIVEGVPAVIPFYAAAPEGLSNLLLRFTTSDVTHSATVGGISITLASYGGAACQASTMRGLLQREVTEVAALCAFAAGDLESVHVVNDSADGWIVDAVEVFSAGSWTALRVDGRGPPYNRWVKKTLAGHEDATFLWL
ncbi:hypothetical protein DIPPA_02479 [Diplonema papillatum]|nr:hypothetical protein DIPPA_02479 [Diplonema papillatum]